MVELHHNKIIQDIAIGFLLGIALLFAMKILQVQFLIGKDARIYGLIEGASGPESYEFRDNDHYKCEDPDLPPYKIWRDYRLNRAEGLGEAFMNRLDDAVISIFLAAAMSCMLLLRALTRLTSIRQLELSPLWGTRHRVSRILFFLLCFALYFVVYIVTIQMDLHKHLAGAFVCESTYWQIQTIQLVEGYLNTLFILAWCVLLLYFYRLKDLYLAALSEKNDELTLEGASYLANSAIVPATLVTGLYLGLWLLVKTLQDLMPTIGGYFGGSLEIRGLLLGFFSYLIIPILLTLVFVIQTDNIKSVGVRFRMPSSILQMTIIEFYTKRNTNNSDIDNY